MYGDVAMSRIHVWKWCKRFNEGRTNVHDEERSSRPSVINEDVVDAVKEKILDDRRTIITDLCNDFLEISRDTMHEIVRNCLGYRKICARWVPKELSPDHLKKRMAASLELLTRYHEEGDDFLDRLITCDKTWVHHITSESK